MSSYILMKFLERSPERYDPGMRWLTGGRITGLYEAIAEEVAGPGCRILDIGCGTAGVSMACASRGAHVVGVDRNGGMLEVARRAIAQSGLEDRVELHELGAAEIEDHWLPASFDAVTACLSLSEMSPDERRYCLATAFSRLRSGGRLAVADEVKPDGAFWRLWVSISRIPLQAATWFLTHSTTRPLTDLTDTVRSVGFRIDSERRFGHGDLALVTATKPHEVHQ